MLYLIEIRGVDFLYSIINSNINYNQKFIQTIESNHLNKLTIKELSFLCNMSESKFKREFKKYFKSSPSKWFQEKRLKHAAFLLQNKAVTTFRYFFRGRDMKLFQILFKHLKRNSVKLQNNTNQIDLLSILFELN